MNSINDVLRAIVLLAFLLIMESAFSSYLTHTDGLIYSNICKSLVSVGLNDAVLIITNSYAGREPVSMGILYAACYFGIDFTFINVATNFLLLYLMLKLYPRNSNVASVFLLLTNFYFLVLLFGIFRFKVAVIFYLLFYLNRVKYFPSVIFAGLSFLSHFQIFPLFIAGCIKSINLYNKKLIFIVLLFLIFYYINSRELVNLISEYISGRVEGYQDVGIFSWKLTLLFIFHLIAFGVTFDAIILYLVLFSLALQFGDGRFVIIFF
jgi:hypothetical protein